MFHVFVRLKNSDTDHPLMLDLSERELQLKFVNSYLDGKDLLDKGTITRIAEISKVTVLSSELSADETLKKMKIDHQAELDRIKRDEGLNVMGSSRGNNHTELIGYCKDVTQLKIIRAPGSGTRKAELASFFHNPWVVGVGCSGLLFLFGVLIDKLWGKG